MIFKKITGTGGPASVSAGSATTLIAASRALSAADNGKKYAVAAGVALTLPAGLSGQLLDGIVLFPKGNITVVSAGGVKLNGATATLSRGTVNPAVAIMTDVAADEYIVTGI